MTINRKFSVTYEIITPESWEAKHTGYIAQNIDLREALELVDGAVDYHCDVGSGVECQRVHEGTHEGYTSDSYDHVLFDGDVEDRTLHFPKHLTESTRFRIMDLMGAFG